MNRFNYEGVQKKLAQEIGCKKGRVSGSLGELAGLTDQFEGPATVYLLEPGEEPSKECSNPAVEEKAWDATTNEEVWINTRFCHELRGSGIPSWVEPNPRKYRYLTAFFEMMFESIPSPLDDLDFVKAYFFRKMRWNGREIEPIYFNKDKRKVFLQCNPTSKVAYRCPACGLKAWDEPGLRLSCLACNEPMAS